MCTLTTVLLFDLTTFELQKNSYNIEENSKNVESLGRHPLWIKFILSNYNM